ncbi:MAG: alpha/beta fold hydrolase [Longimicrobiales bacterium]
MQEVINDILMSWREAGAGQPVLFVHAFPFHGGMWSDQLAALPAGWRGIAPDLRGFGKSAGGPQGPYTMDLFADDLAALLDHLQLPHAVICGLSMGGYTALALYRKHPSRVRALILCDTRAGADSQDAKQNRRTLAVRVRADGVGVAVETMLPKLVSDHTRSAHPDVVVKAQQLMMENRAETVARALEGMALRPDSGPLLQRIEAPAMVVHGEDDAIIPPDEAQMLARGIRGSRIALIPQAGHLSNMEKPVEFNRIMSDFLQPLRRSER